MGHQSGCSKNPSIGSRAALSGIVAVLIVGAISAQDTKQLPAPASPGQAIQDAARASIHEDPQAPPKNVEILYDGQPKSGGLEILSDTKGVDFGPYLRNIVADMRSNWYKLIPAEAQTKKGKVVIEFAILPDGRIAAMKLTETSEDVSLDRPAWAAITASSPLPPLPSAFNGPNLALRFRFYYNPGASDLEGTLKRPTAPTVHAVVIQSVADSHIPQYPKKARKEKIEGVVRLDAEIAPDGKVESVRTVEGSLLLEDAASKAIRKWTFHPAQTEGKPVADRLRINVEFRLDGEQVRAQVVRPEDSQAENSAK